MSPGEHEKTTSLIMILWIFFAPSAAVNEVAWGNAGMHCDIKQSTVMSQYEVHYLHLLHDPLHLWDSQTGEHANQILQKEFPVSGSEKGNFNVFEITSTMCCCSFGWQAIEFTVIPRGACHHFWVLL